jgi:4-aminobutyrate aminotransferase/(S)-3-amino-2-methylpropionate transaminase
MHCSKDVASTYPKGPFNITSAFIKEARGAVMVDVDGRELIDFAGGIGVNNVGHCHPKVVAAIQDQAGKCIHSCFHVAMYEAYVESGRASSTAWRPVTSPK